MWRFTDRNFEHHPSDWEVTIFQNGDERDAQVRDCDWTEDIDKEQYSDILNEIEEAVERAMDKEGMNEEEHT